MRAAPPAKFPPWVNGHKIFLPVRSPQELAARIDDIRDGVGTTPGMGEVDSVGNMRSRPRREHVVKVGCRAKTRRKVINPFVKEP